MGSFDENLMDFVQNPATFFHPVPVQNAVMHGLEHLDLFDRSGVVAFLAIDKQGIPLPAPEKHPPQGGALQVLFWGVPDKQRVGKAEQPLDQGPTPNRLPSLISFATFKNCAIANSYAALPSGVLIQSGDNPSLGG